MGMTEDAKPNLKVLLAAPRGFCAGVLRAIEIVERLLERCGVPVTLQAVGVTIEDLDAVARLSQNNESVRHNPRPGNVAAATPGPLPVYWKTGTSFGFRDAWTIGIFGPYILAVWVGNFDGEGNPAFVGVQVAAPLFFQMVDAIEAQQPSLGEPVRTFPMNLTTVDVCAASGDLPNADCPRTAETWFIPGKSPIRVSTLHQALAIDDRTGLRACPPYAAGHTHRVVYEMWGSDMLRLFEQAGLPRRTPPPFDPRCEIDGELSS